MKRTLTLLTFSAAAVAANADTGGGFQGPEARNEPVTIAEAVSLPDDAEVTVTGFIVRSLGDENYEFRDDSGTLIVEIDDDEWEGLEVTPEDRVELTGEIDRDGRRALQDGQRQNPDNRGIELDVDSIRMAQAR